MRKKKDIKKLGVNRETLAVLTPRETALAAGGGKPCQESVLVCSIQHTCVSCVYTQDTCA